MKRSALRNLPLEGRSKFATRISGGGMRYGPTLLASTLPEEIRPAPHEVAKITRQRHVVV